MPLTAGMQATAVTHAAALMSATIKNKDDINSMTFTTAEKQATAGKKATTVLDLAGTPTATFSQSNC
jgi:hypothetical protein